MRLKVRLMALMRLLSRATAIALVASALPAHASTLDNPSPTQRAAPEVAEVAPFVVPDQPMILTRTMRRELADGKTVTVRRSWELTFTPQPAGYAVEGHQLNAVVEAPQPLRLLAEVEERRTDQAQFSVFLDRRGLIVLSPGRETPRSGVESKERTHEAASDAIRGTLGGTELLSESQQFAGSHIERMRRYADGNPVALPPDLFFPRQVSWRGTREMAMGRGLTGFVVVSVEAERDTETNLMMHLRRTVHTTINGQTRTSEEDWTLQPSPPQTEDIEAANTLEQAKAAEVDAEIEGR